VVTEAGSSFTWFGNSQRHRLTPWSNDPVVDPSGELLYLRDEEDGSIWSPTPRPLGAGQHFVVRHGQGYSSFEHTQSAIKHRLSLFVSPHENVNFFRLELTNLGKHSRRLSLFALVEWVLGSNRDQNRMSVVTSWDRDAEALFATNPLSAFHDRYSFFTATRPVRGFTADREEFFGLGGSRERPKALERGTLSGRQGAGLDPCAALHVPLELRAGESLEVSLVLGDADTRAGARSLSLKYGNDAAVVRTFDEVVDHWDALLGAVKVKTPDAALDLMMNRWLLYQVTSCRLWGRSAFYQSSGAYGFRDQLQDVLSLLHTRPELAREHLLRCAARQFTEGDVQHWWHPEGGEGVRTHCSDDLLWLPYAVSEYVRVTGDRGVLDEVVPFLSERLLAPSEDDLFNSPRSVAGASLYEHCARALDRGKSEGAHGLPKIGSCDWNDGMNRVGALGEGESVWLAWFFAKTLADFQVLATAQHDLERVEWCEREIRRLAAAVEAHGWDGSWYRRAYFDDGTPLGTHLDSECRIDAIAQSWAVIAGIGDPARAALALQKSEELLIREEPRTMLLLWPAFENTPHDPGYIKAYPPGVRENGGQYTHGVLWTLMALARLGEGDRAGRLLSLLNPVQHARTREDALRYRVEPYVVAADVYSAPGHEGRGGWTWYTGAAGWMYRIVLESMLGLVRRAEVLSLAPCIPRSWQGFELEYRYRKAVYLIRVENPQGVMSGVRTLELDGKRMSGSEIVLDGSATRHDVRLVLGGVTSERAPALFVEAAAEQRNASS
jgi:cyclic beta-1,2-glucan synthetase